MNYMFLAYVGSCALATVSYSSARGCPIYPLSAYTPIKEAFDKLKILYDSLTVSTVHGISQRIFNQLCPQPLLTHPLQQQFPTPRQEEALYPLSAAHTLLKEAFDNLKFLHPKGYLIVSHFACKRLYHFGDELQEFSFINSRSSPLLFKKMPKVNSANYVTIS